MVKIYSCRLLILFLGLLGLMPARGAEKNKGELSNLVCFVRFQGEEIGDEFEHPYSWYEQLFNDATPGANSVYNYFHEASYGQLAWKSNFYPAAADGKVVSYCAKRERGYYRAKGEINTIGYEDDVDKAAREQALVREIAEELSGNLPEDVLLDADGDGIIDNMCIVLSGRSDLSSKYLLWPHRSDLALPDEMAIYIKGKKLTGYLMVFDDANGWASLEPVPLNTGVICHEMSHSLGTYDLYHVNDNLNPVGVWDLMSDNLLTPQQMSAYTKFRYCGWIDEIPEISEPGIYELNPVGGATAENIAYKIKPIGSDEYFVVEYRKKEGAFDSGLPESGLLVYRINPAYTGGNVNYNGTTRLDEVYIFRPGGTTQADGDVYKAAFSAESGRTVFGGDAEVKPFYSDGSEARFALTDISSCGEKISFRFETLGHLIKVSEEQVDFGGVSGEKAEVTVEADVDWVVSGMPDWLKVTPQQGVAGKTTVALETLSENATAQAREAELIFTSPSDGTLKAVLEVRQQSNVILPPSDLTARISGTEVVLTWTAPQEGAPVLADGFEDVGNPNNWTIQNAPGGRGWTWQSNDAVRPPQISYSGNYFMHMKEDWDYLPQDEWLVSPVFAYGKTLSFWSKSIAPQKNVEGQFYNVEVSTDGGETWTVVYDLMKDCEVVNQYVKITIDLSDYQSEQMKVAFHTYGDPGKYLSYWWLVDDVKIYSVPEETLVEKYAVYRNGAKIGETDGNSFTDEAPQEGENIYTVRAVGSFGETSDSESAKVIYSGISSTAAGQAILIELGQGRITVQADAPLQQVRLVSVDGMEVSASRPMGNSCTMDVSGLGRGLYILVCKTENASEPVIRKLMLP